MPPVKCVATLRFRRPFVCVVFQRICRIRHGLRPVNAENELRHRRDHGANEMHLATKPIAFDVMGIRLRGEGSNNCRDGCIFVSVKHNVAMPFHQLNDAVEDGLVKTWRRQRFGSGEFPHQLAILVIQIGLKLRDLFKPRFVVFGIAFFPAAKLLVCN
jgi:hypothetical protein